MKKVLIRGTQAHESIGVHAMTISVMKCISEFIPDAKFTMWSVNPEIDYSLYKKYEYNLDVVKYFGGSKISFLRFLSAILWGFLNKIFSINADGLIKDEILLLIKNSDIIIDMFGDGFGDNTGGQISSKPSISHIYLILLAVYLNKPVILYPQSIGPFNNFFIRKLATYSMNKTEAVVAREENTKNYLEYIGVKNDIIHLTADMAFILDPSSDNKIDHILNSNKINRNEKIIGINVSQLLNFRSQNLESYNYTDIMAKFADHVSTNYDAKVILIPHAIFPEESENENRRLIEEDIIAVHETYQKSKNKDKIIPIINRDISASDLKGIIKRCEIFIGARMHANIAAVSSCIPTIAIAYSPKAPGIMKMVGLEEYVCDFEKLEYDDLKLKTDKLWKHRKKIKKDMILLIEGWKKSVWTNGELVKKILDQNDNI